jgi:hypothetical protein
VDALLAFLAISRAVRAAIRAVPAEDGPQKRLPSTRHANLGAGMCRALNSLAATYLELARKRLSDPKPRVEQLRGN